MTNAPCGAQISTNFRLNQYVTSNCRHYRAKHGSGIRRLEIKEIQPSQKTHYVQQKSMKSVVDEKPRRKFSHQLFHYKNQ